MCIVKIGEKMKETNSSYEDIKARLLANALYRNEILCEETINPIRKANNKWMIKNIKDNMTNDFNSLSPFEQEDLIFTINNRAKTNLQYQHLKTILEEITLNNWYEKYYKLALNCNEYNYWNQLDNIVDGISDLNERQQDKLRNKVKKERLKSLLIPGKKSNAKNFIYDAMKNFDELQKYKRKIEMKATMVKNNTNDILDSKSPENMIPKIFDEENATRKDTNSMQPHEEESMTF